MVDTNADGWSDQNIMDTDGDGVADTWAIDSNQDGTVDEVALDQNRDGYADTWGVDANQDGLLDRLHLDSNLDGLPDASPAYDTSASSLYPSTAVIGPATSPEPGTAMDILNHAEQATDPIVQQQLLELAKITADHNADMIDTVLSDGTIHVDLD